MSSFMDLIAQKKITRGEKLESEALIVAQKVLCNMGLDFLPISYVNFLKHYNGLKYNGCYLFGPTVDDDMDIIDKNEQIDKPEGTILLGCNDFDLLCYHIKKKEYLIVDRADFEVLEEYPENKINDALSAIFKL